MFKFAIITDTHIRAPGGDLSSPFPVNERANDRARYAIALIEAVKPDFTIHLGDMVHPLPHMDGAYQEAVDEAHRIFEPLASSLHFVPGNHDIGDKPSPAMPAKPLSATTEQTYQSAFGESRYAFEHQGVVFIVINSSLVNRANDAEQQQQRWLEDQLANAEGKRIFLFSHYPPFINSADESNHYDNYAEPGRSWLLDLVVKHRVEAVISGHVHQFFYNVYQGVKLICLPPTSFIRQDYAELFPTSPSPEFGRDDVNKYSVCRVSVDADGFSLELLPTFGVEWSQVEQGTVSVPQKQLLPLVPHMRHAWFESRHLPYNGPMEEFGRKLARNDYPLLRLLQLGIDTVRIPLSDLAIPEGMQRCLAWHTLGIRFLVFSVGQPDDSEIPLLHSIGGALAGYELVCINGIAADNIDSLTVQQLQDSLGTQLSLSKISTSANNHDPSLPYAHSVSSGFEMASVDQVVQEMVEQGIPQTVDVVFQLAWEQLPEPLLEQVCQSVSAAGYGLVVNVRLGNSNPAQANFDDEAIAVRLQQVLKWANEKTRVTVQCDTFEDVDRGYQPRHGLIDRQGNIRDPFRKRVDFS